MGWLIICVLTVTSHWTFTPLFGWTLGVRSFDNWEQMNSLKTWYPFETEMPQEIFIFIFEAINIEWICYVQACLDVIFISLVFLIELHLGWFKEICFGLDKKCAELQNKSLSALKICIIYHIKMNK